MGVETKSAADTSIYYLYVQSPLQEITAILGFHVSIRVWVGPLTLCIQDTPQKYLSFPNSEDLVTESAADTSIYYLYVQSQLQEITAILDIGLWVPSFQKSVGKTLNP